MSNSGEKEQELYEEVHVKSNHVSEDEKNDGYEKSDEAVRNIWFINIDRMMRGVKQ
jgi:hypothetical protein